MKKIIAICTALSVHFQANAGPLLDRFKANLETYASAQAKTPNMLISYTDDNGQIARSALNTSQIQPLISETLQEPDGLNQLKTALDLYKPVAAAYQAAFHHFPGKYESEYLDSFEIMYRMTLAGIILLKDINLNEIQDETARAMTQAIIKLSLSTPSLLLGLIENDIQNGRFSPSFAPIVNVRLEAMRTVLP